MPEVNTATVNGFRKLSFALLDDVLAEVDRIVAADRAGSLQMLGNWSPAQSALHLVCRVPLNVCLPTI